MAAEKTARLLLRTSRSEPRRIVATMHHPHDASRHMGYHYLPGRNRD
eukprot:CAMPEP_0115731946 /NCGR_PEP_ID=MMETSP0272-20121206/84856_1 /TAXON_ID=71861 /ORGANISM="Scrippsiella trochoidea, Strain CCMP3099" /LENGTH=46 /DNA_ID= /DNA_START= /DNA_END= /DNA_ORIENTATION=